MSTAFHLLQTDQVRCYDADGRDTACRDAGQDAAFGKHEGLWQPQRFAVRGDAVHDRITGAVWCRQGDLAHFPLTWEEARDFVARMRARRVDGLDTWQLPSRRLLFSLLSHQSVNPALPAGHPFRQVFNGYYWSDDTCQRLPDQAWYVHLGGGRVHRGMKHGSYMVWPVAAPSAVPLPAEDRFVVTGRCARDRHTGLMWPLGADRTGKPVDWPGALAAVSRCNRERVAGFDDWRLPNIRELESLVDLGAHDPALAPEHPFASVREGYWSSTTSVYEPRYAWVLYLQDGGVGVGFKPQSDFHVWPVRGPVAG
ncbi:DUF1566 domain-containing protein [Desulfatitalea alkaliphila]|uniref:DUF1566 domain-containing protein n=1 Tax=Desulfatitalea alkaliphila TaxID=2929485 RepID=A0AA41R4K3_9BACT|nr:DUF1566 domain-containing protein [Desulfatitalea alkaliphila]MCJ8502239.1 DUF1566 domain-containing protein [Desulfatitalea alkaliphila]